MSRRDRERAHPLWLRILVAVPLGAIMGVLVVLLGGDVFGAASPYVGAGVAVLAAAVLVAASKRIGKLFSAFVDMLSSV